MEKQINVISYYVHKTFLFIQSIGLLMLCESFDYYDKYFPRKKYLFLVDWKILRAYIVNLVDYFNICQRLRRYYSRTNSY